MVLHAINGTDFRLYYLSETHRPRTQVPVRRPNVVAVGVERHGCRESCAGPWMALRSVPLEWRWSEGTLRAAKGRMPGWPLWLLFLGQTRKVTRRERRNPDSRPRKARRSHTEIRADALRGQDRSHMEAAALHGHDHPHKPSRVQPPLQRLQIPHLQLLRRRIGLHGVRVDAEALQHVLHQCATGLHRQLAVEHAVVHLDD